VTIVFMEVGKTTRELGLLQTGDSIMSLTGPLGLPTHIENYGTWFVSPAVSPWRR